MYINKKRKTAEKFFLYSFFKGSKVEGIIKLPTQAGKRNTRLI